MQKVFCDTGKYFAMQFYENSGGSRVEFILLMLFIKADSFLSDLPRERVRSRRVRLYV